MDLLVPPVMKEVMDALQPLSQGRQGHFVEQVTGLLSPEIKEEIVKALQPPRGGAPACCLTGKNWS